MKGETRFRADCCCCCGHGVPVGLLKKYAKEIPKVELHVHIEGTVGDRLARQIVRENGLVDHPLLQEDTSSSECSSLHGYTRSCTEASSSMSEKESPGMDLPEVEPSTEEKATRTDTVAAAQGSPLHHESEPVSLIRSRSSPCDRESPSNTSPRAVRGEQWRLYGSPGVDGVNTTCTLSNYQSRQKDRGVVSPPKQRAHGSKEEFHRRRENQTEVGRSFPQKCDKSNGRRRTSQRRLSTVTCGKSPSCHDPRFAAKRGDVTRDILYPRNRKLRIYPNLDAFLLDYMDRAGIMRKAEDYYKILLAYLESAAADNVRHVEFHFAHDPNTHIPWRAQLHVNFSLKKNFLPLVH